MEEDDQMMDSDCTILNLEWSISSQPKIKRMFRTILNGKVCKCNVVFHCIHFLNIVCSR